MKKSMLPRIFSAILLALFATGPMTHAEDEVKDLDKQIESIDKRAPQRKPSDEALNEISRETGVPRRQLEKQHQKTKMGSGSLFIANALAKETGKSFDEIVALHKRGNGWGKIAKNNSVKLGPLVSRTKKLEKKQRQKTGKGRYDGSVEKKRERSEKSKRDAGKSEGKQRDHGSKSEKKQKGGKK